MVLQYKPIFPIPSGKKTLYLKELSLLWSLYNGTTLYHVNNLLKCLVLFLISSNNEVHELPNSGSSHSLWSVAQISRNV
jgi:hypothetical protein